MIRVKSSATAPIEPSTLYINRWYADEKALEMLVVLSELVL